ncbi:MAG: hypothetical protein V4584_07865 [Verrucomicrobiota bacterium]
MAKSAQRRPPGREREQGFTLVICVLFLSMLGIVVLGLLSMASVELRQSRRVDSSALAKSNARLALMQAIGQLQRTMGPDQRISATAEILRKDVKQPHWTGVWRSTRENGDSYFTRDDLEGGLRDERSERKLKPDDLVMEWLVSGRGDPSVEPPQETVALYHLDRRPLVEVPALRVKSSSGTVEGHCAWWTGDLGVRANLRTSDPRAKLKADGGDPGNGGLYRVMASQAADMKMMDGGVALENEFKEKLLSPASVTLAGVDRGWSLKHDFDFTMDSSGVLADVAKGGLKRDLTAYFESGPVAPFENLDGLTDSESLVGVRGGSGAEKDRSRYAAAGPRFGLLRDWARLSVPFSGKGVKEKLPEFDSSAGRASSSRALANEKPVKLAGNELADLKPILVEATNFTQMSCYLDRAGPKMIYQLRQLMYPRVVLWNPYNCELRSGRSIIMMQGNGRQEMWTKNVNVNKNPYFAPMSAWLNFEGGRSTSFGSIYNLMNSAGYNDPYMGSYYFAIPETLFKPGECLVFSPPGAAEYNGLSVYRPTDYNLNENVLSCEVSPDPARCYYVSASEYDDPDDPAEVGGIDFLPVEFWYAPTPYVLAAGKDGILNQADDSRAILKQVGSDSKVTFESFDALPQITVLSGSLQYGAGREPRISWNVNERMPLQLLDKAAPHPTAVPNVRTREGIRLRWFQEHPSNIIGSGALAGTAHFEEALIANWNPRASFVVRSPWENVAGTLPKSGPGGGPWFFGAYTRDLYDQAVGWDEQAPVPRDGRYHGNPFGPPQEGNGKYVLFDVPRSETGLVSLGQFQHAKLSELIWHPSYAVGNSLADPRLGTGRFLGLNRTAAVSLSNTSAKDGGFHENEIGWSGDSQRSSGKGEWAATARSILGDVPERDNLVYDLSFEVNQNLWDRYYLSSGSASEKRKFLEDPKLNPLPNGRMGLVAGARSAATAEQLMDFHQSAGQLMVGGAFNVNSTRVEAWKAMLGSTRLSGFGDGAGVPFPRMLDPQEGVWKNGDSADSDKVWAGYRELDETEVGRLAEAIVEQVKLRGPFISLADFVNRRLAEDETGRMGALQAAIEKAGLNSSLADDWPLDNKASLPDYNHPDHLPDATRMEQTLKPASKAWGASAYLTQADLLQVLGPVLSARSDTFVIRAYGDAVDASGKITARAWCEAVVQREPQPLDADESGINPRFAGQAGDFGRRFALTSFRWLSPDEI